MDWEDLFPWLFTIVIGAFALALGSIFTALHLHRRVAMLTDRFGVIEARMRRLDERPNDAAAAAPMAADPTPPAAAQKIAEPPPVEVPKIAAIPEPVAPMMAEEEPQPAPIEPAPSPPPATASPAAEAGRRWEKILAENWLVWLGGVTLALGGAFLVKLSIDHGLLTPGVRVILAALLGIGLAVLADRLARREREADPARTQSTLAGSSYVPQALAAAGAAIVFASIYAAYQLYGLLPSALAFPLLAATAGATVAMSLRHGPLVAALGLVGAYVVPLLIESDAPRALPLFAYLAFVTAASLALLRHRAWWWLAWLSLAGATLWVVLWLVVARDRPESVVVALYLLVQLGLFAAFRLGIARIGFLAGIGDGAIVPVVTRVAFGAIALAMLALVHVDGFGDPSLAAAFAMAVFVLWFGHRDSALDDVIAVAGALLLALLATWHLPFPYDPAVFPLYTQPPAQLARFVGFSVASVLLLGGGCFALSGRVARPGRWAALSAAAPVVILMIAYWRTHSLGVDIAWTTVALGLAGLELMAAASIVRRRTGEMEIEIALAAYSVGVLSATILATTFALSTAWLSIALALHLPAMGWIEGRIRLPVLRWLARAVASAVVVRLVLNPYVLSYPMSATPIFNWLLYGYGVPAAAFIVATRQFGSRADDLLVWLLEAGSIVFTTLLLTLELRHALYGTFLAPYGDLGRDALSVVVWLAMAAGLFWLGGRRNRPVLLWGGIILFGMASAQAVLWQTLVANPLITGRGVGGIFILDALTLAYALPALLYAAMVWLRLGPVEARWAGRVLATGLAFVWLSLEIRHAFHGAVLTLGRTGEAEWYAYSAAWLAFAATGLAAGLIWHNEWVRRASLGGIGLVIAKVFLFDMAALSGVLRALSFLGLGGALIGIGYAYRRLQPLKEGQAGT